MANVIASRAVPFRAGARRSRGCRRAFTPFQETPTRPSISVEGINGATPATTDLRQQIRILEVRDQAAPPVAPIICAQHQRIPNLRQGENVRIIAARPAHEPGRLLRHGGGGDPLCPAEAEVVSNQFRQFTIPLFTQELVRLREDENTVSAPYPSAKNRITVVVRPAYQHTVNDACIYDRLHAHRKPPYSPSPRSCSVSVRKNEP